MSPRPPVPSPPPSEAAAPGPVPTAEHPAQRRILTVLVVAQILSGAALAAGFTIGPLLAKAMLGSTGLAGVPSALFAAGAALGSVGIGRSCRDRGRRRGLTLGYTVGAAGSLAVVGATVLDSVVLLLPALFVYGAGTASIMLARYAGADLASPARRGRALGTVLFATAAGAIAGPNLVGVTGDLAAGWGVPRLAGPFLLAFAAFAAAALFLGAFLRPDPLLIARDRPEEEAAPPAAPAASGGATVTTDPRGVLVIGVTVMVLCQLVMIAIMTMTPIHMTAHGHSTGTAGMVIGLHLGAMYLMSPVSGYLADRLGRLVTAALSTATLLAAALLASFAPPHSAASLTFALVLLGIGWNLGFVSGSALVTDALPASGRATGQSTVDFGILVVGATGGMLSGVVVAVSSFHLLALGGGILLLVLVPLFTLAAALPSSPAGRRGGNPARPADDR
ncbi:MFS transporter [Streptomyces sp. CAU 1734]|uniref:MFS transporter n=1 Tax=Streptomyces sp. CAU 1734 TaxID=3140360 RepID=UPI00325FE934